MVGHSPALKTPNRFSISGALLLQTSPMSLHTGNHGNHFRIHVSSGLLMRGPRPLDRERNSSHVLTVEAYNHDLGPMRSSVRVSGPRSQLDLRCYQLGLG